MAVVKVKTVGVCAGCREPARKLVRCQVCGAMVCPSCIEFDNARPPDRRLLCLPCYKGERNPLPVRSHLH